MTAPTPDAPVLTTDGRETLLREIETYRAAGDHPRAERLADLVRTAEVVPADPARASVGSRVTVADERGTQRTLTLVATHEGDRSGAASVGSPTGMALLGRAAGTAVAIPLPDGRVRSLRILAVDGPPT